MPDQFDAIIQDEKDRIARSRMAAQPQQALTPLPSLDANTEIDPNAAELPDPNISTLHRILKGASLAFEPLDRTTKAFRETLLFAGGKTTFTGMKRRVAAAFRGESDLSGRELTRIIVGNDLYKQLDATPLLPKWVAPWMEPEIAVSQPTPKLSIADALSFGVDLAADPFVALSFTPVGVGAKLLKIPFLGKPYRALFTAFNKVITHSPIAWIASPQLALPDNIWKPMLVRSQLAEENANTIMHAVQGVAKRANVKEYSEESLKLGAWLKGVEFTVGKKGDVALRLGTQQLPTHLREAALQLGDVVQEQVDALVAKGVLPKGRSYKLLHDFMPRLSGTKSIPKDILQSWSPENVDNLVLRMVPDGTTLLDHIDNPKTLDVFDAIRDFTYGAQKELHVMPELRALMPGAAEKRVQRFLGTEAIPQKLTGKAAELAREDPRLAGLSIFQRRYLTDLINVLTGDNRGRKLIVFDLWVLNGWENAMKTATGQRVLKLFNKLSGGRTVEGGLPDWRPTAKLTGILTHNIIRSVLGGNISSAVVNSTQTLNYSVKSGLPATFAGMLKFGDPELRALRKNANLMRDFNALWEDGIWQSKLGKRFDEAIMFPFQSAERWIRGTGFNVGAADWMKRKGFKTVADVRRAGLAEELTRAAHFESLEGAFLYGNLGRAPIFSNPLLKPATALLSFGPKQLEFYYKVMRDDPSALMRFIGIHGFLIEQLNKQFNIAGEDFLGFGFMPMTRSFGGVPILTSPTMGLALDMLEAAEAWGNNDPARASHMLQRVKRNLPTGLGVNPLPWIGITDVQRLYQEWTTQTRKFGPDGEGGFAFIDRPEAITRFLVGRSTTDKMRQDLGKRITKANKRVAFEMDQRADKFVAALMDTDGDKLGQAAWDSVQGIDIEGQLFYPTPEQFANRVQTRMEKRTVPKDLLDLKDLGFLESVFIRAQLELLARQGGVQ